MSSSESCWPIHRSTFFLLLSWSSPASNVVRLGERENDVELADVAVVLVHLLDVAVDDLERDQLVVVGGAPGNKEERSIATVDDLGIYF